MDKSSTASKQRTRRISLPVKLSAIEEFRADSPSTSKTTKPRRKTSQTQEPSMGAKSPTSDKNEAAVRVKNVGSKTASTEYSTYQPLGRAKNRKVSTEKRPSPEPDSPSGCRPRAGSLSDTKEKPIRPKRVQQRHSVTAMMPMVGNHDIITNKDNDINGYAGAGVKGTRASTPRFPGLKGRTQTSDSDEEDDDYPIPRVSTRRRNSIDCVAVPDPNAFFDPEVVEQELSVSDTFDPSTFYGKPSLPGGSDLFNALRDEKSDEEAKKKITKKRNVKSSKSILAKSGQSAKGRNKVHFNDYSDNT